nr:MAG TPA: hypothetical protein [Caudoviricetes sp.]
MCVSVCAVCNSLFFQSKRRNTHKQKKRTAFHNAALSIILIITLKSMYKELTL